MGVMPADQAPASARPSRSSEKVGLTAAYQQANEVSPDNVKIDPDNRFLWHHKPQRLEAEIIRDAVLAVGGSLDLSMFGPSILDNTPCESPFDVSGPMSEAVILGTVAVRVPGVKLEWDTQALKFANSGAADSLLRRSYRDGWKVEGLG